MPVDLKKGIMRLMVNENKRKQGMSNISAFFSSRKLTLTNFLLLKSDYFTNAIISSSFPFFKADQPLQGMELQEKEAQKD